jgi:hypothetical protein
MTSFAAVLWMTIAQHWMKDKLQQCLTKQSIIVTIYVRYIAVFLNVTNRIDGVMLMMMMMIFALY